MSLVGGDQEALRHHLFRCGRVDSYGYNSTCAHSQYHISGCPLDGGGGAEATTPEIHFNEDAKTSIGRNM